MKKRLLAMILTLIALFSASIIIVLGGPGSNNPPIELTPTSHPYDPYEPDEPDEYNRNQCP